MTNNEVRFCTNCQKKIYPVRTFTAGVALMLIFLGVLPGIIYYYWKERKCPECKESDWDADQ